MSPIKVDLLFRNKFISRGQLISDNMKDAYYESAHKGQSRGKYLYSSILSNYINTNIAPALKNLDKDVSIIASTGIKNSTIFVIIAIFLSLGNEIISKNTC